MEKELTTQEAYNYLGLTASVFRQALDGNGELALYLSDLKSRKQGNSNFYKLSDLQKIRADMNGRHVKVKTSISPSVFKSYSKEIQEILLKWRKLTGMGNIAPAYSGEENASLYLQLLSTHHTTRYIR